MLFHSDELSLFEITEVMVGSLEDWNTLRPLWGDWFHANSAPSNLGR